MDLAPGALLVAEPTLLDPNFRRAVILLCDHNTEGSFGLILNRPTDVHLTEVLVEPVGLDHQLFVGGPVQPDTLHFLHAYPDEIEEAIAVTDGVAWGGPFDDVAQRIRLGALEATRFRFFAGYAGWGPGQLEAEAAEDSWIVLPASRGHVFEHPPATIWRDLVLAQGGPAALFVNYPEDPRTN
jgi:putative transcriptional regulator